ncbi:Uma2 family endonuclease [Roseofilum capinflatum]|uniref:Uma2 family endonuclease n=1 Tax=Roseofilum capinflatum BLCC-M114 TaxID=3022440 RepID=A0ABT7B0N9_9CYAN|nr:Uma2 family endonuclease [Roseofilum capinflatum]MDJ1172704.1 Uma2 family endonuclease [Roseofilum capinflatum BLCC-M114]
MTDVLTRQLTLEQFLEQPNLEGSPAWEYIDGGAIQKPMPKFRHSLLQKRLLAAIDRATDKYLTLPELRCTFGGRSIVPDVVVLAWDKVALNAEGEPEDNVMQAPDWSIEILSPDQSSNRVIDNLLHCLQHGSQLGWLVDPQDRSILVLTPGQGIVVCRGERQLPMLADMDWQLTAEEVFSWLKLGKPE